TNKYNQIHHNISENNRVSLHISYSFFFSSRRRHTISKRDWSSDVCSSDLNYLTVKNRWGHANDNRSDLSAIRANDHGLGRVRPRSEERRVGKEFRDVVSGEQEYIDWCIRLYYIELL